MSNQFEQFGGNRKGATPVVLNHVSGGRTKHRMILVRGAVQTTAWPVGLLVSGSTRSPGTATHVSSINTS